jgi:nucleoside-diphosphate-sugar epimerase
MKEKVLVTGGTGFIGSHLVEALIKENYEVVVLDNLSQGRREWLPSQASFMEGDITDVQVCKEAVKGVSAVFHLAAMSRVAPSIEKFEFCTEQNIIGTQNLLIASRDAKVKKFIYSGSSSYYGDNEPPYHEDQVPGCLNPYALSKYVGEQFCLMFTRIYNLPTVVLRYFNVYGPRQPREGSYALVLGVFLDSWKKNKPLIIHGDGSQRRDFVHVRDVVQANIKAYQSQASGIVCNIGSGSNISIKEVADLISSNQVITDRRAGDAKITIADITNAKKYLHWEPKIGFSEGLKELMDLEK